MREFRNGCYLYDLLGGKRGRTSLHSSMLHVNGSLDSITFEHSLGMQTHFATKRLIGRWPSYLIIGDRRRIINCERRR